MNRCVYISGGLNPDINMRTGGGGLGHPHPLQNAPKALTFPDCFFFVDVVFSWGGGPRCLIITFPSPYYLNIIRNNYQTCNYIHISTIVSVCALKVCLFRIINLNMITTLKLWIIMNTRTF